ncbi:MAG: hypothetical protein NC394_04460 [Bacteroides sp.]|nr:hypothetical protein [Bacteroides sp.]
MVMLSLVLGIILLMLNILMANKMKEVAEEKGYDAKDNHIFAWCFWLPLFGYLYVIALPDAKQQYQSQRIISLLEEAQNKTAISNAGSRTTNNRENQLPEL